MSARDADRRAIEELMFKDTDKVRQYPGESLRGTDKAAFDRYMKLTGQ